MGKLSGRRSSSNVVRTQPAQECAVEPVFFDYRSRLRHTECSRSSAECEHSAADRIGLARIAELHWQQHDSPVERPADQSSGISGAGTMYACRRRATSLLNYGEPE